MPRLPEPVPVTVVHSHACHFCDDAFAALRALGDEFAIDVRAVDIESAEGATLVALHRPAMSPLVLVAGEYFAAGRLPRRKLAKLLRERTSPVQAG